MQRGEILKAVADIFSEVLDEENIVLDDNTTADQVEGWDSLTHIQLVVALEKHFKVRFTSKEIQGWSKVGEMIDSVAGKL